MDMWDDKTDFPFLPTTKETLGHEASEAAIHIVADFIGWKHKTSPAICLI